MQAAASDLLATLISIHAPREGSDYQDWTPSGEAGKNFYPRSPRGERHHLLAERFSLF